MRLKITLIVQILLFGLVMQLGGPSIVPGAAASVLPYDIENPLIPSAKMTNTAPARGADTITVNAGAVVRATNPQILGINTNYLTDYAAIRNAGQGYTAALQQLGVKSLRYPEGEMADEYLWSSAPFTASAPTLARTGPNEWPSNDPRWVQNYTTFTNAPLNFDEFMSYARATGAEPTLVVAFDSMYKPATAGGTAPSKQLLLDTAVAWVRYANVVKGYGVKHWEIGNESYVNAYNGGTTAQEYARDLVEFSRAMKAVDPTIQIGANGPDRIDARGDFDSKDLWWQTVLQIAAPDIDFLAVHSYPAWQWGSYEYYRTNTPKLTGAADAAVSALARWAPRDAGRIRIAVTEMNSADWSKGGWASEDNNTLGHALVLFEMVGAYLQHPQVDMAQVWNTRWIDSSGTDLWNTLDANNGLRASGKAMAIWGQFMRPSMVQASNTAMIRSFASLDPGNGQLSVFLINKDTSARSTTVVLSNYPGAANGGVWRLRGTGSEDLAPSWGKTDDIVVSGGTATLTLDPVSITVITLAPASGTARTAFGGVVLP
jgi:alpha-N-arabinofuranosidase